MLAEMEWLTVGLSLVVGALRAERIKAVERTGYELFDAIGKRRTAARS
jgi:hypothetical protein